MVRDHELFVSPAMFKGVDRPRRRAYLTGVYRRHGHGNYIVFANAAHKAALVAQFLREERCDAVTLESVRNTIPNSNVVKFSACDALARTLRSDLYNGPRSDP